MTIRAATDTPPSSAECTVAQRPECADLHRACRQTEDVPLPHGGGLLLMRRCGCTCHAQPGDVS